MKWDPGKVADMYSNIYLIFFSYLHTPFPQDIEKSVYSLG